MCDSVSVGRSAQNFVVVARLASADSVRVAVFCIGFESSNTTNEIPLNDALDRSRSKSKSERAANDRFRAASLRSLRLFSSELQTDEKATSSIGAPAELD